MNPVIEYHENAMVDCSYWKAPCVLHPKAVSSIVWALLYRHTSQKEVISSPPQVFWSRNPSPFQKPEQPSSFYFLYAHISFSKKDCPQNNFLNLLYTDTAKAALKDSRHSSKLCLFLPNKEPDSAALSIPNILSIRYCPSRLSKIASSVSMPPNKPLISSNCTRISSNTCVERLHLYSYRTDFRTKIASYKFMLSPLIFS